MTKRSEEADLLSSIVYREVKRIITNTGLSRTWGSINGNPLRPDWISTRLMRYTGHSKYNKPRLAIECEERATSYGGGVRIVRPEIIYVLFDTDHAVVFTRKREVDHTGVSIRQLYEKRPILYNAPDALMEIKDCIYDVITEYLKE